MHSVLYPFRFSRLDLRFSIGHYGSTLSPCFWQIIFFCENGKIFIFFVPWNPIQTVFFVWVISPIWSKSWKENGNKLSGLGKLGIKQMGIEAIGLGITPPYMVTLLERESDSGLSFSLILLISKLKRKSLLKYMIEIMSNWGWNGLRMGENYYLVLFCDGGVGPTWRPSPLSVPASLDRSISFEIKRKFYLFISRHLTLILSFLMPRESLFFW